MSSPDAHLDAHRLLRGARSTAFRSSLVQVQELETVCCGRALRPGQVLHPQELACNRPNGSTCSGSVRGTPTSQLPSRKYYRSDACMYLTHRRVEGQVSCRTCSRRAGVSQAAATLIPDLVSLIVEYDKPQVKRKRENSPKRKRKRRHVIPDIISSIMR